MSRRRALLTVIAFAALSTALVACGGDDDDGGAQDPATLEGKAWVVTQILDENGDTQIVDIGINASFDGSAVSGVAACNNYNASYEADGGEISIGPIAGTLAACPEDEEGVANRYLQLLEGAATFEVEGRSMSMSDAEGTPTIQFSQGG